MKAILKNYRQAPRKMGLIAGLIRGKKVGEAKNLLNKLIKRGALPMFKLLNSAISNAKINDKMTDFQIDNLTISIMVNKGVVLKRFTPRAQGSASPIHKHSSNIILSLVDKNSTNLKIEKSEKNKKEVEVKKVATKKVAKKIAKTISKK